MEGPAKGLASPASTLLTSYGRLPDLPARGAPGRIIEVVAGQLTAAPMLASTLAPWLVAGFVQ